MMPRAPVKPQDRKRVPRACDPCKASKKRCNGLQPCVACEKKGNHDVCSYTLDRRHKSRPQHNTTSSRLRPSSSSHSKTTDDNDNPNSSGLRWNVSDGDIMSPGSMDTNHIDAFDQHDSESDNDNSINDSSSEILCQPPIMLTSVSGDKVYVGSTAAISFLQFLQKTLKRHVGPSVFTDAQESRRLFEADTTGKVSTRHYEALSMEEKKGFLRHFLDASSGLLDLYSWHDVVQLLEVQDAYKLSNGNIADRKLNSLETASLYVMIAIGAQCCGRRPEEVAWAAELFCYARTLAFKKMLENPSVELVRMFLLMSFYMCGACRRNSAFMYLGVATKAASILGLHQPAQYRRLPSETRKARILVAKSLRVFDVVCSSILGRSGSSPPLDPAYANYIDGDVGAKGEDTHRALALDATHEIAAILDTAVTKSADGELDAKTAEDLVSELQQRSRGFPAVLRRPGSAEATLNRRVIIGNIHVSGAYYFSVILVTRQFLIQHIVPQLSGQALHTPRQYSGPQEDPAGLAQTILLADACLEAATFMASMCYRAVKSGHVLGNMCILKAWTFATGLVLGFGLLVEDTEWSSERRTAFVNSLHVLDELKLHSPQAEQYYNTLASFHNAIKAYKEQIYRERHASKASLVDRVFLADSTNELDQLEATATQLPSPNVTELFDPLAGASTGDALSMPDDLAPIDVTLLGDNDFIMRMLWGSDGNSLQDSSRSEDVFMY